MSHRVAPFYDADTGPRVAISRFSATWPHEVRSLASEFLNNFVRITVGNEDTSAALSIEQRITICDSDYEKEQKLVTTSRNGRLLR